MHVILKQKQNITVKNNEQIIPTYTLKHVLVILK